MRRIVIGVCVEPARCEKRKKRFGGGGREGAQGGETESCFGDQVANSPETFKVWFGE